MASIPQVSIVYNRRKTASSDRTAPVEVRISYNYKQRFINTGVRVYPKQWKNGKVVNNTDSLIMNAVIENTISSIRNIILDMVKENCIDITAIPKRLKEKNTEHLSFMAFCEQRASIRKYGKSTDSQKRYDRFIRLFKEYGRIVEFNDINDQNIIDYDRYLISTGMKPYSKWNNYHRFLNSFILDAIDAGYINRNPYKWLNIHKDRSYSGIGKYLTFEEWRKIKSADMPIKSLARVRDLFIFQTYTCLSYSDLKDFDSNLISDIKGMKVYVGKRNKTGKPFTIPMLPGALEVLHKYNNVLPIISNVKYNEYLKAVALCAGVDKPISSHWARHTGATMLLNSGIDMGIVSKICGHSSIKITEQVYAKLLDDTVVEAVNKFSICFILVSQHTHYCHL